MKTRKEKRVPALSLGEFSRKRAKAKRSLQQFSTAELYQVATRHFLRFVQNPQFSLQEITLTVVADFTVYLRQQGLSANTVNTYLSSLRAIYNAAVDLGLVHHRQYPFKGLKLQRAATRKRAIPETYIRQIAQIPTLGNQQRELAIDISVFCFLACGMPFVDIAYLTKKNIRDNELVYRRRKTGSSIRIEITAGMWHLIRKYEPKEGNDREYLFPILPASSANYTQYKHCLASHNQEMKKIGQELQLPDKFTSYVIRHSWASAALRCDVPVAVISQALGHTSEKTTRYYLNELDSSDLTRANRKVSGKIDLLLTQNTGKEYSYL